MKIIGKGINEKANYIYIRCQCTNGVDQYKVKFCIKDSVHTGYGCYQRTPDLELTIFGKTYNCYWGSPTTGYDNIAIEKSCNKSEKKLQS